MIARVLAERETVSRRAVGAWRSDVLRSLGFFELPRAGGLVWVLGTKHRCEFLESVLFDRPDHLRFDRSGVDADRLRGYVEAHRSGGTVVLENVVRSLSWMRDETLSGLILRRPPRMTVVVCTDVPIHATDAVLAAIDATVVLPARAGHFAPLAYSRYLRSSLDDTAYHQMWAKLLRNKQGGNRDDGRPRYLLVDRVRGASLALVCPVMPTLRATKRTGR